MSIIQIPRRLPLLVSSEHILLPGASMRISVKTLKNINLVKNHLLSGNSLSGIIIGIVPLKAESLEEDASNIHRIGTAAIVTQVTGTNWPRPAYTILCTGLCRFCIDEIIQETPTYSAAITQLDYLDEIMMTNKLVKYHSENFRDEALNLIEMLDLSLPTVTKFKKFAKSLSLEQLSDLLPSIIWTSFEEKLDILNAYEIEERCKKVLPLIVRQIKTLKLVSKNALNKLVINPHNSFPSSSSSASSRNSPLNDENDDDIVKELEKKIRAAGMNELVEKISLKELRRLKLISPMMPEFAMLRTYLELMVELPWNKSSLSKIDINKAKHDIELDHYGLDSVKKRIIEFLAVKQKKNCIRGPILCFVGPPGVGKTSIGKSIANSLGRQLHRISLGGICDQSNIRGHRRTYIGSMPGCIIHGLKVVKVNNPVFLLDEIDKLSRGIHGDPSAALLEALDPEQNFSFVDHYLNVPFDLSQVLFIATANDIRTIPQPLLDRMELIELPGYTHDEKLHIAKRHLIPKQLNEHGLSDANLKFTDAGLRLLISGYTREAGVRELQRKISSICRSITVKVLEDDKNSFSIDQISVEEILGSATIQSEIKDRLNQPGVAVGLAWTPMGGEILFVEAIQMAGEGRLILTGQLGEVMKESAELALNWLRSNSIKLGIQSSLGDARSLQSTDIHVHFPAGAVSKDGPSAGVTIATVLLSLLTGFPVRSDTAMTGEITLRGLVLPVGGIKEKVLAAHRNSFFRIILPKRNKKDLKDIPANITKDISFILVENLEGVFEEAFERTINIHEDNYIPSKL